MADLTRINHTGAQALRTVGRTAAVAALLIGASVVINAVFPTPAVLLLLLAGIITGLVSLAQIAFAWSDLMAYARTSASLRFVIGGGLMLAGAAILLSVPLFVSGLSSVTWQRQRGVGVVIFVGVVFLVSGVRLLRR